MKIWGSEKSATDLNMNEFFREIQDIVMYLIILKARTILET